MRKFLTLLLAATLSFLIWATISSTIENIVIDVEIMDFVKKAVAIPEASTPKNKYYVVKSEEPLDSPCYVISNGVLYPGGPGDIMIAKPCAAKIPVIGTILTYYLGGHASLCAFNYADSEFHITETEGLEVTGIGSNIEVSAQPKLGFQRYYDEYMCYRVKTSLDNRKKAFMRGLSFVGEEYNFSFMFNLGSKKYCSDLVSRSYEYVGVDLNKDNVATSILDIAASSETFLCYYTKVDTNGVRHHFILDDSYENL